MKPLINKKYLLEKYPGKGGWTYAAIPEVLQDKHSPFGWVKVKGSIDEYEIKNFRLMPMGNGQLFLPVKAAIRKAIGKQAGDYVQIVLYADQDPLEIPEELVLCLLDNPDEYKAFLSCAESKQKEWVDWIYAAKTETARVDRIAQLLDQLAKRK